MTAEITRTAAQAPDPAERPYTQTDRENRLGLLVQMYRVLLGVEVSRLYLERMAGCSDRLAAGINRVPFLEEGLHAFFRVFRTRTEDLIAVFNGHR